MGLDGARFANLAIKVGDLADTAAKLEATPGCEVVARHPLGDGEFIEARVGATTVNFFSEALYERPGRPPVPDGFLHASFFVDDLDEALSHPTWKAALLHGPEEIEGGFGRRRIAFFELFDSARIELMEDQGD